MASSQSPEARELALVDKVELRIALADDDAKLQSTIATYLAPLLLKLASEHGSVRNKVIGICQHVNTRTKPENIQLPVIALIKQFKEHSQSQLIQHFDMMYIQRGFPRLPQPERAGFLPTFTSGISYISSASSSQASVLFNLFLRSLLEYSLPPKDSPEEAKLRATLDLSSEDAQYLTYWIGKLILFRPTASNATQRSLSRDEHDFLSVQGKDGIWTTSSLMQTKYACVKFVGSSTFKDTERLMPVLLASADSNPRVSALAEDILRLTLPEVNTNDERLIKELFDLYLRGGETLTSSAALRIKILGLLSKTSASTCFTTEINEIVLRDLVQNSSGRGREATKLRASIVQLLGTVARQATARDLKAVSGEVLEALKSFLDQQHDDRGSTEMTDLRCRSFEVVGLLIGADEEIVTDTDLSVLRWLFSCLSEERNKQVVFSIDEALSRAIRPLQMHAQADLTSNLKNWLEECVSIEMDASVRAPNQRNTVHTILRLANRCLPFSDLVARAIDISVLGSTVVQTPEIIEEARKGLDPYWMNLVKPEKSVTETPSFTAVTERLLSRESGQLSTEGSIAAMKFCRRCLFWLCLQDQKFPSDSTVDWENKMDMAIEQDHETRTKICAYLHEHYGGSIWQSVLSLFKHSVSCVDKGGEGQGEAAKLVFELTTLCPIKLVNAMSPHFDALRAALSSNDLKLRALVAQSFGLLASSPVNLESHLDGPLTGLLHNIEKYNMAIGAQSNRTHGAMIAAAHFVSRRQNQSQVSDSINEKILCKLSDSVFDILASSSDAVLRDAAFRSISQLCMFSCMSYADLDRKPGITTLIESVSKAAKDGNEAAILALGHVSIVLDEDKHEQILDILLAKMRELHEIRQPETHFTVGESFANVAAAWKSKSLLQHISVDYPAPKSPSRTNTLNKIIQRILEDSKNTKPALKKASVIWLLCILEYCGGESEVQERLTQFQVAFKRCLSDRDNLVQESASRGLGLVYQRGSRDLKDDLVRDLINSFSSNKADISGSITQDTELFEAGALPTGDGSVTTYKDIMSLASEVGDPSLVYRFMSLASNNAIWSNRAAFGRYGLSNVLSDSSTHGYLADNPKIYPALYRYRFDPNSNVRRAMNDIWNALVKDPATTVDKHLNLIINDLLDYMTGREWRARQAACAAVADLLQGRKLATVQAYLDRTWSQCFKVLDDIKETVREAAAELARVLTNILLRNLESNEGKGEVIEGLLKSVIPFLLSPAGLESSAKEVQTLSLHTLLEIIKKGKPNNFRPFIPHLIHELIALLTSFEPEVVNYVALNAQKYNLKQADIDDARLKSIKSSPIMEAIERALDMMDEDTMAATSSKLQEAMRSAVGVPSKVGISRILVSLSTRKNLIFRRFADEFLNSLEKRIVDRNETVSSSYAASMGYITRLATDSQVLKTIKHVRGLYFNDADDDRPRFIAGEVVQAIAKYATDRFNALASDILPFVFFGRFDDTKQVSDIFKETYNDTISGPRVVSLYLSEIVFLSREQLASHKWTFKHAAAKALAEAAESLAGSHGTISQQQAQVLWTPLSVALAEKSWDGKARVLEGFVVFVQRGENFWREQPDIRNEIKKIALREAKRRNKEYQVTALACLGKVSAAMQDEDMLHDVNEIATAVMNDATGAMDVDEGNLITTRLAATAVEATFDSIHLKDFPTVHDLLARSSSGLDRAHMALELSLTAAHGSRGSAVSCSVFASLKRLCDSLRDHVSDDVLSQLAVAARPGDSQPFMDRMIDLVSSNRGATQEKPRTLRAEAIAALTDVFPLSLPGLAHSKAVLASRLQGLIDDEKSLAIRSILLSAQRRVI